MAAEHRMHWLSPAERALNLENVHPRTHQWSAYHIHGDHPQSRHLTHTNRGRPQALSNLLLRNRRKEVPKKSQRRLAVEAFSVSLFAGFVFEPPIPAG